MFFGYARVDWDRDIEQNPWLACQMYACIHDVGIGVEKRTSVIYGLL